jgi:hypothetical protein
MFYCRWHEQSAAGGQQAQQGLLHACNCLLTSVVSKHPMQRLCWLSTAASPALLDGSAAPMLRTQAQLTQQHRHTDANSQYMNTNSCHSTSFLIPLLLLQRTLTSCMQQPSTPLTQSTPTHTTRCLLAVHARCCLCSQQTAAAAHPSS